MIERGGGQIREICEALKNYIAEIVSGEEPPKKKKNTYCT